ncbi:MAG: hypoxanthine phosphoribosyltransferase [Actinobacteria bacterium]|nr:hypoxanthine phosphoribosyltransferase [Actinomycetota bacterium]
MDANDLGNELSKILVTEAQLKTRLAEMAREIEADYGFGAQRQGRAGNERPPLLVGVLKGAAMVMADLARELKFHAQMDWMAVSSYGAGTKSSGVVKILKDLDADISGRDVLIVEDIVESGLTLSWLRENLESRGAKSVRICTMLRKPEAMKIDVEVAYVGFDIPVDFVVGYGLDYAENYRNLRDVGVLAEHVYSNED